VRDRSFRPGRYGHLLADDELPAIMPARFTFVRDAEDAWMALLELQRRYRTAEADWERKGYAEGFSRLVATLHGRPWPEWYTRPSNGHILDHRR